MLGTIPFGGISSTGNTTAQAVTTSAALLALTGGTAIPSTGDRVGDPAVKADPTNSRIQLNAPGIYRLRLEVSGLAASALQTTHQFRKGLSSGAMSVITGTKAKKTWGTTPDTVGIEAVIEITAADLGTGSGGASTFADPSAAAGVGKPAGGFAGAGAAPKTGVYVDSIVTGDGSVNLTLAEMRFDAQRCG